MGRRKRAELLELLRPCFVRVEPWLQAGKYAAALMSQFPRRNGWTIAEHAGDRSPDKTHRTYPRVVKRTRHNSYRVKRPSDQGIRHTGPSAIKLANLLRLSLAA